MQGQGSYEIDSPANEAEIDHGVPVFLAQLMDALRLGQITSPEIYGHNVTAREIVRGTSNAVPHSGRRLVDVLQKKAARNASTAAR